MSPSEGRCAAIGVGIIAVSSAGSLLSQPASPTVQIVQPSGSTNYVLTTSTEPGYFYTMQFSSDLLNWAPTNSLYASGASLSWTNALSTQTGVQFFRAKVNPPNTAVATNYPATGAKKWTNAIVLGNGLVEAVINPNAGRIQQFRFVGSTNLLFYENPDVYGQTITPDDSLNGVPYGGDKSWPAPQSDWKIVYSGWPPPYAFEGNPYTAGITNGIVTITNGPDPDYHIQVTRSVQLLFDQPVMQITTVFKRLSAGAAYTNRVGIWFITEVVDPGPQGGYFVAIPPSSIFAPSNYCLPDSTWNKPLNFKTNNGVFSFTRDTGTTHHIGFDATVMAWVGSNMSLRID